MHQWDTITVVHNKKIPIDKIRHENDESIERFLKYVLHIWQRTTILIDLRVK